MPSSLPYDHPSLVLGNIVDTRILNFLRQIASAQSRADAAQEKMNSLVMMKRSLSMTLNELMDMGVDIAEVKSRLSDLDNEIKEAATGYMTARLGCEDDIRKLREQISRVETGDTPESPVDFTRSAVKRLPLAAESIKLDAQYFSFGSSNEDDTVASIEQYVRESTADLGSHAGDVARTAASQVSRQRQNHHLAGTLIITASCTHRDVALIEPFVVDVDKAIDVWNATCTDKIDTADPGSPAAAAPSNPAEESLTVLSGVSYGSSFVGMVHMVKTEEDAVGPPPGQLQQLQERLRLGGWLENAVGGFGVDPSVVDEVKRLLSTQSITSHVSLIVLGAVPSIASSELKQSVKTLVKPDAGALDAYVRALAESSSETLSVQSGADGAHAGKRLLNAQSIAAGNVLRTLGEIDQGSNKVLGINSLMSGFENYLAAVSGKNESAGVPINFFLKKIPRSTLLGLWKNKYYPDAEGGNAKPDAGT